MLKDAKKTAAGTIEVYAFRCCDAGWKHCGWVGNADTEELLFVQIEQHALNHHNLIVEGEGKEKIRSAITRRTNAVAGI